MINAIEYDRLLRQELDFTSHYESYQFFQQLDNVPKQGQKEISDNRQLKRDNLFWDFRYQVGSYKARKAGISQPSVMMKCGREKFRLYGDPLNNKLYQCTKDILAGWKAKTRAEKKAQLPEYRAWLKENRFKAKDYPFWHWRINIQTQ